MTVKPLEWEEIHAARSDEDPTTEFTGEFEAECLLGVYSINMGFGSDCYYWGITSPDGKELGSDFEDPLYAKAAAQADYEARIMAAIQIGPEADHNDGQFHDLEVHFAKETVATVRRCALEVFGSNCAYPCHDVMRLAQAAIQTDPRRATPEALASLKSGEGFSTSGAEGRWIEDMKAGVYDTPRDTEGITAVADEIMSDLSGYLDGSLTADDEMEATDLVRRVLASAFAPPSEGGET